MKLLEGLRATWKLFWYGLRPHTPGPAAKRYILMCHVASNHAARAFPGFEKQLEELRQAALAEDEKRRGKRYWIPDDDCG
jgi:hypothetical protein